jgi:hypothetical protein
MTTASDSTGFPLKCRCGTLRGVAEQASGSTGNRLVCYCDDCQTFARWLEVPGVLDSFGGTEVFQMAPARLKITAGTESLACVRLSPKGLFRFYAGCCRTPVANMAGPRIPFVGIAHPFMDFEADGRPREVSLGPVEGRVQGRFAIGGVPPGADAKASFGVVVKVVGIMAGWWLKGLGSPSPFFDASTGALRMDPKVLTREERERWRHPVAVG